MFANSAADVINIQFSSNGTNSTNPSNITNQNPNLTNRSGNLNTTIPEQLPPESINGSKTGKI